MVLLLLLLMMIFYIPLLTPKSSKQLTRFQKDTKSNCVIIVGLYWIGSLRQLQREQSAASRQAAIIILSSSTTTTLAPRKRAQGEDHELPHTFKTLYPPCDRWPTWLRQGFSICFY